MPGNPGGVSSPPTWKFISTVTTGARAFGTTTTCMPFASVSFRMFGSAAAGRPHAAARIRSAASAHALWQVRRRGAHGLGARKAEIICLILARLAAERAEAPLTPSEVLERASKAQLVEIRPQAIREVQLRVGAFPEQEVAQALLAAGADQKVDLAGRMRAVIHLVQQAIEGIGVQIRIGAGAARGLEDAVPRGVVDGDAQVHPVARRAHALTLLDRTQQALAQPIPSADDVDADRLLDAAAGFAEQGLAEQKHERRHLGPRPA